MKKPPNAAFPYKCLNSPSNFASDTSKLNFLFCWLWSPRRIAKEVFHPAHASHICDCRRSPVVPVPQEPGVIERRRCALALEPHDAPRQHDLLAEGLMPEEMHARLCMVKIGAQQHRNKAVFFPRDSQRM